MKAHSVVSAVRSAFGQIDHPLCPAIALGIPAITACKDDRPMLLMLSLSAAANSEPLQHPRRLGLLQQGGAGELSFLCGAF